MGGFIVQAFHARHSGRVASMTLCDTRASFGKAPSAEAAGEFVRLRLKPLQEGKEPRDIALPIARSLVAPDAPPQIVQRLVDSISVLHKGSYMKTVAGRGLWQCGFDPRRVAVPTLVVCGTEDVLVPPGNSEHLARTIPGAALHRIAGAGHAVTHEDAEGFAEAVRSFALDDVAERRRSAV